MSLVSNAANLAKAALEKLPAEQKNTLLAEFCAQLKTPPVSGGADKAPNLQSYAEMLYSKSKEKVIRSIAEDALKALGVGNTQNAQRVKIDIIIKKLKEYVPDPQHLARYGHKFYKSAEEQKRVCDVFTDAINKQYGGVIISTSIPVGERCKQVSEVLHSLIAGMHNEFLGVAADVNRVLNNINVVGEVLDSTYNKVLSFLDKAEDDELKQYAKTYRQLYAEVKSEFDRQQAILANLMNNTITPAKGEIVKLLQENPDFKGLVDNLEQQIGTEGFGRKLASLVSNASGVVYAADQVDKAMKKIGLSLEQLKSAKDMKDLHAKAIKSIMAKKPDTEELNDMMKAVKVLFENSYNQNEIIEQLSKQKRGAGPPDDQKPETGPRADTPETIESTSSDASSDSEVEPLPDTELKAGGAVILADNDEEDSKNLPMYFRKHSIKKKILDKDKQRKLMFGQFRTLLRDTYNNIVSHATQLGPMVGNEIPTSDELEKFINLFSSLPALDRENIHIALTGYPRDLTSREQRESFLNQYALVAQSIEPLVSGPHGSVFSALKSSIEEMIKVVDNFTQTMVKPLTEIHVDSPQEILEKVRNMASRIYTGSGAADREPFMAGDWTTFNRVKTELRYFYSISIIKKNMAQRAADNQAYAEDYVRVLGEESGWLINKINAEFNDLIQNGNPETNITAKPSHSDNTPGEQVNIALKSLGDENKAKQIYKNLKLIWNNQLAAKVGMVKAAQAIDLYLKAFTKGIAKDPDSVKSIASMLDGIQFVAKWFIERSGDNLTSLLEFSPEDIGKKSNSAGNVTDDRPKLVNSESEHYYQKASAAIPFVGNDLGQFTEKQIENLMKFTDKTLNSTRALENIISVFVSVGDKFKDVRPSSETFMNGGQLQNALVDYMRAATFSTHFGPNGVLGGVYGCVVSSAGPSPKIATGNNITQEAIKHNVSVVGGSAGPVGSVNGLAVGVSSPAAKFTNIAFSAIPTTSEKNLGFWAYYAWDKRTNGKDSKNRRYDSAGWEDAFYDTDMLFLMTIKSIVAKVFTVVDAYRLFNRPTTNRILSSSLSPVRTVLGGGAAPVKVIPEALELYFRLPLLAEWYREKFGFNSIDEVGGDGEDWVLALVPNIDGIWSDLFAVIFDKARQIKEGNYTETQVRDIVEAINTCFKAYRGKFPKATCRDIVHAFIMEVNRAYGFIQKKQVSAFVEERHKNLSSSTDYNELSDPQQYDILNSENQFKPGPAPSDKYVDVNIKNAKTIQRITMQKLQDKMVQLHQSMDYEFLNFVVNNGGLKDDLFSFKDTISNYKRELALAKSDEQQYQIILRALQNTEREVVYSGDKMIIIHEMLNAPLAILYGIYEVLLQIACTLIAGSYEHGVNKKPINFKRGTRCPEYIAALQAYQAKVATMNSKKYLDGTNGEIHNLLNLLNLLVDLSANKIPMVGISVAESGKINIDFNKIGEFAKALIADLRNNVMKIKSMFTKQEELAMFEKYESSSFSASIRTIEETLIEVLINDRDECGLQTACAKYLNQTLASYATKEPALCNTAIRSLIYYEDRPGALPNVFTPVNLSVFPFNVQTLRRTAELKEDKLALSLVSNSHNLESITDTISVNKEHMQRLNSLLHLPCILFESPNTLNTFNIGNSFVASYDSRLFHNPSDTCIRPIVSKSLFFALNKMIHMYIHSNMLNSPDPKIYGPLIESFMNSAASREILEGKPFPNVRNLYTDTLDKIGAPLSAYIRAYICSAPYDVLEGEPPKSYPCTLRTRYAPSTSSSKSSAPAASSAPPAGPRVVPPVSSTGPRVVPPVSSTGPRVVPPVSSTGSTGAPPPAPPVSSTGVVSHPPLPGDIPTAPAVPADLPKVTDSKLPPPGKISARPVVSAGLSTEQRWKNTITAFPEVAAFVDAIVAAKAKELEDAGYETDIAVFRKDQENYISLAIAPLLNPDDSNKNKAQVALARRRISSNLEGYPAEITFPDALTRALAIKLGGAVGTLPGNLLVSSTSNSVSLQGISGKDLSKHVSLGSTPQSPQENSLLYASTAITIKSLMYAMNLDKTKKRYLFDGLADIPQHLKEKMQINLPMFSKMFQSIIDRAAFLKRFITYNPIGKSLQQKTISEAAIRYSDSDPNKQYAALKNVSGYDNAQMSSYLLALLTKLNDLAIAIKKCCDGVYNELNDKIPYFMELRKDGVAEYKHRTGHYPFAPASFMMLPLTQSGLPENDEYSGINGVLLPSSINGSYAYQLNNALRVVYNNPNSKFNIEHFPSVKELYNAYLASFDIGKKLSSSEYITTLEKLTLGSKYLNELLQNNRLFCTDPASAICPRLNLTKQDAKTKRLLFHNSSLSSGTGTLYPVLSLRHQENTINKIIELQDIVDHRVVKDDMLAFIGPFTSSGRAIRKSSDREALRVYNILDLQISPVNFSAFMREIPFTNIINYAYTFDRMTHDFIMPEYLSSLGVPLPKDNVLISADRECNNVKSVLIKFLLHPYAKFSNAEYFLLLFGVFGGMNDFGIGRPKFLNDQIFNKVLLTSPYNLIVPLMDEIKKGSVDFGNDYRVQGLRLLASTISKGLITPSDYKPNDNLYFMTEKGQLSSVSKDLYKLTNALNYGRARFDTKIVRNVCWLVTLQLIMRHSITKHLSWIDTPVIRGLKLLDHKVTEFDRNKNLEKNEFDTGDYEDMLE